MPMLSPPSAATRTGRTRTPRKPMRTDWWVMALPTVLALRNIYAPATVGILMIMIVAMFAQNRRITRTLAPGPLIVLGAATGVVFSNPEPGSGALFSLLAVALAVLVIVWAVLTVDARTVISSLVDGVGVYALVNVVGYAAGLRSLGADARIGGLNESTGFTRIIYPLAVSLEEPPIIASVFIVAVPFLLLAEKRRRPFRLACLLAAGLIAVTAASRTSMFIAATLPVIGLLLPVTLRWMAPLTALFASISAVVLPNITKASEATLAPILAFLTPGRTTRAGDIASLSKRDIIWSKSIDFWVDHVRDLHSQILGFGQTGQFRSGVSIGYSELLSGATRYSRRGTLHNTFLQQLFDGGVAGWLLLAVAFVWTGIRFSHRLPDWGAQAKAAVLAVSALMLGSTSGATLAPGFLSTTFMVMVFLVAIACQLPAADQSALQQEPNRVPYPHGQPGRGVGSARY